MVHLNENAVRTSPTWIFVKCKLLPKVHVLRARGKDIILRNYGSSVLTVQSSIEEILRTIMSVATLPELSPTAIHESA